MLRLEQLTYKDRLSAMRAIGELSREFPPATRNRFDMLASVSPAPEEVLHWFTRLHREHPSPFQRLTRSTAGLRYLIAVFAYSAFLAKEVVRHPEWMEQLLDQGNPQRLYSAGAMRELLEAALPPGLPEAFELAQFRRRQMLRILIRDVLGLATLTEITGELTALADAIVETAYARIHEHLTAGYGEPGNHARFAVIALGKMGGEELNYSSDIDLMFLYSANGETNGPQQLSNKEFFLRAANRLTTLLSTYGAEGLCYRVDLRLRPDGSNGELCLSLDAAKQYYAQRARDWELQMMIKARAAAGDTATGHALLDFVEPLTYKTTLDFSAIEQLSETRERLNEKLAQKPLGRKRRRNSQPIDVKLAPGGIRDIEFLVQCLQRLHGGTEPWVRHGGTMLALARLHDKGFLSDTEYGRLASAYQFLRQVEHRIQFDEDRQTHALPADLVALELLEHRVPGAQTERLLSAIQTHFSNVRDIYERVVHSRTSGPDAAASGTGQPVSNIVLALEQRAPNLAHALARSGLRRGYKAFEHFLERLSGDPARLDRLDADANFAARTLDLFEHSPYFAEELIRSPELVDEIAHAADPSATTPSPPGMGDLRRWYRREMLRLQAASVCLSQPIFESLERTSDLADAVIARAYAIAIAQTRETHVPENPAYRPADQMWVIALGRLGMREFDMASDADLVFVLPAADAVEMRFWTRVAERFVDLLTAYTGEGMLFTVDTRLRPNGVNGELVQSEGAFKEYFAQTAGAWEGITYMKSRVVAGDPLRAEFFLHELQDLDWKRYGQGGRSRTDLKQMRAKLEKEQRAAHPFKAGRGGYYDIDFILMYLRLRSAGIYYKVLNTPERIEVLEGMGQLDRSTAQFLNEAATFYRAVDHGIRVITGHAQDKLPAAEAQVETLTALVKRWSPVPLSAVDEIRAETRRVFERIFG